MPKRRNDVALRREHPLAWLWEPMAEDRGFALKSMFGAKVAYLDDVQRLAFAAGKEPWDGLLVCTSREHHASLISDFPALRPHPVLPKWLYLPVIDQDFERTGKAVVSSCLRRDVRIGVVNTKKRVRRGREEDAMKGGQGRVGTTSGEELANVVNLGEVSASWLKEAGITRFSEMKRLGAVGCCRRVAQTGRAVSAMLAYAIEGAILGVKWEELPQEVRAELRAAVTRIKNA